MANRKKVTEVYQLGQHLHSLDLTLQLTEAYIEDDNREKAQSYIDKARTILEVTRMVYEKLDRKTV